MSPGKHLKKFIPGPRRRTTHLPKQPGTPPGTVQYLGQQRTDEVRITIHDYDDSRVEEIPVTNIEEARPYLEDPSRTWIKVSGLHDVEKLKTIWSYFDLHPLIQEDIVHPSQRPKVEQYENCTFIVVRALYYSEEHQAIETEQISLVLGGHFVLSFQETETPFFAPILTRLSAAAGRMRKAGPDYLTYALIDTIVDYYFKVLETISEQIEAVEDELMEDPTPETFQHIHRLRRTIIHFRKTVWPLRDVLNSTIRDGSPFIAEETNIYLRDVYDHMVQVIDNIENYRDMVTGMHDMYMSHVGHKMNEVMKVLTIIATIFIPLTFIAGIYGMNFDPGASPWNMPELGWYWGYPAAMGLMAVIGVIMVIWFRRKGWL